ncbi:hypothetical protein [Sediminibacillus massiliensis]|uniref:hypothetical protein n=1 Tax=Sediminibacillus massiliensis TaxID=1926277 RepID=UPI0015C33727|nr:hypothetical protein [Sediminibacillus massiliensis]
MNSSPYEHVRKIVDRELKGEQRQAVLDYLDNQHAEIGKLEKRVMPNETKAKA